MILNTSDLILHFADKYIAEREKNIRLQQQLEQHISKCKMTTKLRLISCI